MPEWMQLTGRKFRRGIQRDTPDVDVEIFTSPYDMPEAVRADIDPSPPSRLVIEFKYINDEPTIDRPVDPHVTMRVGKNTGRLYGIVLNAFARDRGGIGGMLIRVNGQELVAETTRAIDSLSAQGTSARSLSNYAIAKEVISERGARLFTALGFPVSQPSSATNSSDSQT